MRLARHHLSAVLTALSAIAYSVYYYAACGAHPRRDRAAAPQVPAAAEAQQALVASPAITPSMAPAKPSAVAASPRAFDERGLMSELRALRLIAPEKALQFAKQANLEHPDSPGAAERAWIAVRSLEDLHRFHEAQDVARDMQGRYPGTFWTEDVERHVLLHPLDLPSREEQQASLQENAERER